MIIVHLKWYHFTPLLIFESIRISENCYRDTFRVNILISIVVLLYNRCCTVQLTHFNAQAQSVYHSDINKYVCATTLDAPVTHHENKQRAHKLVVKQRNTTARDNRKTTLSCTTYCNYCTTFAVLQYHTVVAVWYVRYSRRRVIMLSLHSSGPPIRRRCARLLLLATYYRLYWGNRLIRQ